MSIHFISQLNLSMDDARNNIRFLKYLSECWGKIEALYLIDNVFDVWTGDYNRHHVTEELVAALTAFNQQTPVFIQTGSHDFLLGDEFSRRTGITLLPSVATLEYANQSWLLVSAEVFKQYPQQYQDTKKQLIEQSHQAMSPQQQQQVRQTIVQMHQQQAIYAHQNEIQSLVSQMGMKNACLTKVIHGHVASSHLIDTVQDAAFGLHGYNLPKWSCHLGNYFVLADAKQLL